MRICHGLWLITAAALLSSCAGRNGTVVVPGPTDPVAVYTFPGGKGGNLISPSFDAVEGDLFQVSGSANILVTAIGYEVDRTSQQAAPAAIFDASGNVLAVASISSADTVSNGYYWKSISPLPLMAGSQYYIGGFHGSGFGWQYTWNTEFASTPSFVSDLGTYFKISSTIGGGTWQYGGGTSQYGSGEIRHYIANFQARALP